MFLNVWLHDIVRSICEVAWSKFTYTYWASSNSSQRVSAIQVRDSWGAVGRPAFDLSSRGNEQKPILLHESVDRTATKQRLEGETRIEMETKRDGGGIVLIVLTTMMMGPKWNCLEWCKLIPACLNFPDLCSPLTWGYRCIVHQPWWNIPLLT